MSDHVRIKAIASYLPDKVVSNDELEGEFEGWSASKIEKKIGVRERRVVSEGQTALDLAEAACRELLKTESADGIDFLLLCTQSPDYYLPTSACLLQNRLGLPTSIGALDYNLGCSGFIYGLAMASGLIKGRMARKVLLVMAETYSKHLNPRDKANRTIFGDGAAAVLLEGSDHPGIHEFVFGTNGMGCDNLIVPNGGMKARFNPELEAEDDGTGSWRTPNDLYMNGPEIFNFTIDAVPIVVNETLDKHGMTLEDVDYVIFHQANKYMLNFLRKKIGIPEEKFYNDLLLTGNTVSATIPLALKNAMEEKLVQTGDKVLLVGFGVGYSWGGTIITI